MGRDPAVTWLFIVVQLVVFEGFMEITDFTFCEICNFNVSKKNFKHFKSISHTRRLHFEPLRLKVKELKDLCYMHEREETQGSTITGAAKLLAFPESAKHVLNDIYNILILRGPKSKLLFSLRSWKENYCVGPNDVRQHGLPDQQRLEMVEVLEILMGFTGHHPSLLHVINELTSGLVGCSIHPPTVASSATSL
jgi:hypothetical protein